MYEDVLALLHKTNASYEKFEHEPVLDYETDPDRAGETWLTRHSK